MPTHGLINYVDTKAECRHLKQLTCNGTLPQVFAGVYRLEIQSFMLVFSTQLCELLPLLPLLWFNSPPFPVSISILCTRIQCVGGGGGMGFWGQTEHLPQSPFTGKFPQGYDVLFCLGQDIHIFLWYHVISQCSKYLSNIWNCKLSLD
jgi:hypothetical protein